MERGEGFRQKKQDPKIFSYETVCPDVGEFNGYNITTWYMHINQPVLTCPLHINSDGCGEERRIY